jgi:ribosomal protein S18 acetylase RimI-like enzyme
VDSEAVLAAFNEQVRRRPEADPHGGRVEHDDAHRVIRHVSATDGWNGVVWSDLDEASADAAIAAQLERFAEIGREWEWKHYTYDRPADLEDRLRAAGFQSEPVEAFLVAEIAELELDVSPPDGVELRAAADREGVDALVAVHDEVFGEDHSALGAELVTRLESGSDRIVPVVAWAGEKPVSAGRVEFHFGTHFASLWGGGTLPEWRRRGVFRALVAHRAGLAAERGFRYLQVDASPDSRPILRRLGFAELAMTTPFVHEGRPAT